VVLMAIKVGCAFSWNPLEFLERYFQHYLNAKNADSEGEGNNIDEY